ncbi:MULTISPECIES: SWIM zinc finger family protein [unclassified Nocardioides]|uniref:SWIM zinc finger family protein n=1 Tax=unclassified Nocardioides TaxID=2615069 RepID=UPI0000571BD2|nr:MULTISPECIES: SWIM zinc finger family protein [unclassified Nocardioides]ABL79684.1 zinc finger, SWIM domain protein [Nocardioides sp. JS614]
MTGTVLHPRVAPRRATARATTWWGKAWVRAVDEAAYAEADLVASRALARAGRVGQIATEPGRFVAAVEDRRGLWTVEGTVPVLGAADVAALVETVAAESGRIAALLAGELPHRLVEHAEEAGVELLPYGGELGASCTCEHWVDPCVHALAVLHQLAWLVDADPFVLLQLRGLARDELLGRLHERSAAPLVEPRDSADGTVDEDEPDLQAALEAALYAARLLVDPLS